MAADLPRPLILPLGDSALLVRFAGTLDARANRRAIGFARRLVAEAIPAIEEVAPNLVSVLIRFDPTRTDGAWLAGEIAMLVASEEDGDEPEHAHVVPVRFDGPDLDEVAGLVGMSRQAFIAAHNASELRVLAIGFAPGFAYCGFHPKALHVPRRTKVRARVPAGTVLFAAGQTAIAATAIPTGWHAIGTTSLANFDPARDPPVLLQAGDSVRFEMAQ